MECIHAHNNQDSPNQIASYSPQHTLFKSPSLPVISAMVSRCFWHRSIMPDFSHTVIIGVQHILGSTASLFEALIMLGIKPNNLYFTGKFYSTSKIVEKYIQQLGIHLLGSTAPSAIGEYTQHMRENIRILWKHLLVDLNKKTIKQIIILDEGGRCLENIPPYVFSKYRVCAIEQTKFGLGSKAYGVAPIKLIDVSSTFVKQKFESPLIASAVLMKVRRLLPILSLKKNTIFGVIGYGNIGKAVSSLLLSEGYTVLIFDKEELVFSNINTAAQRQISVNEIIVRSDIIFGCSGSDVTKEFDILNIKKGDKIFISCSSEDKEFYSLLDKIPESIRSRFNPLSDLSFYNKNGSLIKILRGGFPVNFDNSPNCVPPSDIQLTRGLLLGACLQAIFSLSRTYKRNKFYHCMLDPNIQKFVVEVWSAATDRKTYSKNINIPWIIKHSSGLYYSERALDTIFHFNDDAFELIKENFYS